MDLNKKDVSIIKLRVIDHDDNGVKVLFPSISVPVQMSNNYFEQLKSSGDYNIQYDITKAG